MAYGLGATSSREQAPTTAQAGGGSLQQRRQQKLTSAGFDIAELENERESARAEMLRADRFLRASRMRRYKDPSNPDLQLPLGDAEVGFDQARRRFMEADRLLRSDATDMTPEEIQGGRDRLQSQYQQIRAAEPGQIAARAREIEDQANSAIQGYAQKVEPRTRAYYGTVGDETAGVRARVVDEIPGMTAERLREVAGLGTYGGETYPQNVRRRAASDIGEMTQAISPPGRPDTIDFGEMPTGTSPLDEPGRVVRVRKRLEQERIARARGEEMTGAVYQAGMDEVSRPERSFGQDVAINQAKILGLGSESELNQAKAGAIGLGEGMLPEEVAARGAQAGLTTATARKQTEQIQRGGLTQDALFAIAENAASNFAPLANGTSVDPAKGIAQLGTTLAQIRSLPEADRKAAAIQILGQIEFQFPGGFAAMSGNLSDDYAGQLRQFYATMRQWSGGASVLPPGMPSGPAKRRGTSDYWGQVTPMSYTGLR